MHNKHKLKIFNAITKKIKKNYGVKKIKIKLIDQTNEGDP